MLETLCLPESEGKRMAKNDKRVEEIVKLATDNDLVEEVYSVLHFIIINKLDNLRNRVNNAESDLRLIKKFVDANKLDVIKYILF